jgi:hypothetical protein
VEQGGATVGSQKDESMVKLLTHNFLCSNVKGVKNPYPLRIRADQVEYGDAEFEQEVGCRTHLVGRSHRVLGRSQ